MDPMDPMGCRVMGGRGGWGALEESEDAEPSDPLAAGLSTVFCSAGTAHCGLAGATGWGMHARQV